RPRGGGDPRGDGLRAAGSLRARCYTPRVATGTARATDPQPPRPWLPLLAFVILGFFLLAGILPRWGNAGAKDWNTMTGQLQAEVTTLLRFGQFPLWNPWRNGGQPSFAQPES